MEEKLEGLNGKIWESVGEVKNAGILQGSDLNATYINKYVGMYVKICKAENDIASGILKFGLKFKRTSYCNHINNETKIISFISLSLFLYYSS